MGDVELFPVWKKREGGGKYEFYLFKKRREDYSRIEKRMPSYKHAADTEKTLNFKVECATDDSIKTTYELALPKKKRRN